MIDIPYPTLEKLFRRHLDGEPVCRLAKEVNASSNTLARRFKKYFNYTKHGNNYLSPVISEYLSDPSFSKHRKELESWFEQNIHLLIREGQMTDRYVFTEDSLDRRINAENLKLIVGFKNAKSYRGYPVRPESDEMFLHQLRRLNRVS